ncbi:MAG: aldo/keto reductase [Rhizomicrobium sp.]
MTTLPLRPLGRTDIAITRIGFGAWAAGGSDWAYGWGGQEDAQSIATIRRAVDAGINWIDTAAVYGLGHSEEIVGKALADIPANDRPFVFTKAGFVGDEKNPHAEPAKIGNAASLRREVEASLKRLGVERIDLCQMHWPAEDVGLEEYWSTLLDLKKEGKIRAAGLSNHSVEQLEQAESLGTVDCVQPPFSALRRSFAGAELPWCVTHQTGVIVYSPMQSGLLSGRFSVERLASLPEGDWRKHNSFFRGDKLTKGLQLAESFKPIAERHNTSVAAVAIAWTLAFEGVTGAIVGARTPAQIDGFLPAATLNLTKADLEEIATTIHRLQIGRGPAKPQ